MKPHYLFEAGIQPWRECDPPDPRFETVSVVVDALADLLPIVNPLLVACGERFPRWFRWHTARQAFEGNAIQQRRLSVDLGSDAGGFRDPVVRMGDPIVTGVASIALPLTAFELETLSDNRRELVIGTADATETAETLCSLMMPHAAGFGPGAMAELLAARNDLIFGRCYEDSDTHAAFQWYGHASDMRPIGERIAKLGIQSLRSRSDVGLIL